MDKYTIYFDGSATPNPGRMHVGYAIFEVNEEDIGAQEYGLDDPVQVENMILSGSHDLGTGTSNEAEYSACELALQGFLQLKRSRNCQVTVYGDSKLVINQVNKLWRVTSDTSRRKLPSVKRIISQLEEDGVSLSFEWVPRLRNDIADSLSKGTVPET